MGAAAFSLNLTSPTNVTVEGTKYPTINNGGAATLTVTAPATSGSTAVIWIGSYEASPGQSSDLEHFWLVGVSTP
jgi:hypothetical protein